MESPLTPKKKFPKKWVGLGVLALFLFWMFASYNTLVRDETGIKASDKKVLTAVDSMVKKIETAGITVADLKATIIEVMRTTIGPDGRSGTGTFIHAVAERYPEVPSAAWRDLVQTANAEYEAMESSQNDKIARIQAYETRLGYLHYIPTKIIGGFPRIDLEQYGRLILGDKARSAGETGKLETVDPFKKDGE